MYAMTPDSQEIMEPKRDARYDNQMPSLNSCSIISCRVYSTTNLSSCMRPSLDRSIAQEVASWSRTTKNYSKELLGEVNGEGGCRVVPWLISNLPNCSKPWLYIRAARAQLTEVEQDATDDGRVDGLPSLDLSGLEGEQEKILSEMW